MSHKEQRQLLKDRVVGIRIGRRGGRWAFEEGSATWESGARGANDTRYKWYRSRLGLAVSSPASKPDPVKFAERCVKGLLVQEVVAAKPPLLASLVEDLKLKLCTSTQ